MYEMGYREGFEPESHAIADLLHRSDPHSVIPLLPHTVALLHSLWTAFDDAMAAENRGDRRSTLDELARGISDLGDRVKRIPRD